MNCETCGRQTPQCFYNCSAVNPNVRYKQCGSCASENCEAVSTITDAYADIMALRVPVDTLRAVSVWDDGYLKLIDWIDRWFAHKRVVPCTPEQLAADEEKAEAAYLVEKMKQVAVQPEPTPHTKPRRWLLTLVSWLGLAPTWELSS